MNVYAITVCQNGHQAKRVKNFLKTENVEILNPKEFCYKHSPGSWPDKSYGNVTLEQVANGSVKRRMLNSDEVWVILSKSFAFYSSIIETAEKKARDLGLKIRYFKINQTGRYVGRTREIEKEVLFTK